MAFVEGLAECYLFAGVPKEVIAPVHDIAEVVSVGAQGVVFNENDEATHVYLLRSGLVTLSFSFQHQNRTLHVDITPVKAGELFGWSTLTQRRRFSAQAVAEQDSDIIRIPGERLRQLMDRDPRLGYTVMDRLTTLAASRLASHREQLRLLLEWA
ncbi:MAG: Crp/Fnr family transcriptional regulator [Armatimonadetes bacterium]|nr:Crp/Fnr family transcriptional regulator [Armatimonadota bacterium]